MNPEQVRALAENTLRLRQQAIAACQDTTIACGLSQELRAKTRQRLREHMEERVRRAESLREQFISRRLLTGRLPRASAPVLHGAPGTGGNCDGCDKSLTPTQLVMAIPWREPMFVPWREPTFVHLHADCFMIWNAIRPLTEEDKRFTGPHSRSV